MFGFETSRIGTGHCPANGWELLTAESMKSVRPQDQLVKVLENSGSGEL